MNYCLKWKVLEPACCVLWGATRSRRIIIEQQLAGHHHHHVLVHITPIYSFTHSLFQPTHSPNVDTSLIYTKHTHPHRNIQYAPQEDHRIRRAC